MKIFMLILLLPFSAFLINGIFGRRYLKDAAQWVSIATIVGSMVLSYIAFAIVATGKVISMPLYHWVAFGEYTIRIGFQIDHLTAVMLLIITTVSLLVHIYTVGYLHGDKGYYRFFAYLSLFTFSMLVLVMGENYLLLFVGWELVGLCSYLLIGFWYHKKSATDAGKKAFVANRVGDFGFGLGIMTIFTVFKTFDYNAIFAAVKANPGYYLTYSFQFAGFNVPLVPLICVLLAIGAMGKSAQIPLYVWLPDAMEGPTSCSALIHAATMVTAGVYMMARSNAFYVLSPGAMQFVAIVGASTAIFAATIALVQNDIKKVLAYSTISQLGYMVLACGVGAFQAAFFHLATHAFFKALLFMGAGSVIHGMSGEQDMRKMGGLLPHMKWTGYTFLAGTLAISGFPLLSGFFSKDQILGEAFKGGHQILWFVGLVTAFLTAFYMFRLFFMTFLGKSRVEEHAMHHLHESPKTMTMPLVVLASFSIFLGMFVGLPLENGLFHRYLGNVLPTHHEVMAMQEQAGLIDTDKDDTRVASGIVATAYASSSEHSAKVASSGGGQAKEAAHGEEAAQGEGHGESSGGGEEAAQGEGHGESSGGGGHLWLEIFLIGSSVFVGLLGIYIAYLFYLKRVDEKIPERIANKFPGIYKTLLNKYYVDEFYDFAFIGASKKLGYNMWRFDEIIVDGIVNNVAAFVKWFDVILYKGDVMIIDGIVNGAASFVLWFDQILYKGDITIIDGIVNGTATTTKWLSKAILKYVDIGIVDFIVNFIAKLSVEGSGFMYHFFDLPVVDGMVNGICSFIEFVGEQSRKVQNGYVQNYVFVFVFGLIILISLYLMNVILAGTGSI